MTTAGITAARLFPNNNSTVVMGVANKGSKLRVAFSPTIEYEAIAAGMAKGIT